MNTGQWSLSWPWPLHSIHHTSSYTSGHGTLSFFKLCISKHRFCSCAWIYWTPNLGSCIGISCKLITISNSSAWVEIFGCDSAILRCDVRDATNQAQCFAYESVIFSSRIIIFGCRSRSHGVSPGRHHNFLKSNDQLSFWFWSTKLFVRHILDLCYSGILMITGVLSIPHQHAVLQCTHQCGLFNVIICNLMHFPYYFHYEPKLIRVFIPTPLNTGNLILFTILNCTPCVLHFPHGGKINHSILLKLLLLMILLRKLICGFVVANSCIYHEFGDKTFDPPIFNFFLCRVLMFQH